MTLALARCLDDADALWLELEAHWRQGSLVGLAPPQERPLLSAAVLGGAAASEGAPAGADTRKPGLPVPAAVHGVAAPAQGHGDPEAPHSPELDASRWGAALVLGSGGSSGGRRWCLQPLAHLQASARACGLWLEALGIEPSHCLLLDALPLHHVSGLMPLIRARQWRAELRWLAPGLLRDAAGLPQACPLPAGRPVLLSLVPTQLQRLLDSPEATDWLRRCALIWVGGASIRPDLAERARDAGLPLAPCYGATETAAMVCALPPQRFLAGEQGCGPPLSDVELRLEGEAGAIAVRSARISPGWFEAGRLHPFRDGDGWWRSGDAGRWIPSPEATSRDASSPKATFPEPLRLRNSEPETATSQERPSDTSSSAPLAKDLPSASLAIRGRLDGALLSGGETVFPEQLEQRLRALAAQAALPLEAVLLLGVPEEPWGERLAALVRPRHQADGGDLLHALRALTADWPAAQRPRRWWLCPELAPSEQGKWQRQQWRQWLTEAGPAQSGQGGAERR